MNYLTRLTVDHAADIVYGGYMLGKAMPLYDRDSEKQQEVRDLAEKLFAEKIKPVNMTGDVLVEAVTWASNHMDSALTKLSESLESPNAGGMLQQIVYGYLWLDAEREARLQQEDLE